MEYLLVNELKKETADKGIKEFAKKHNVSEESIKFLLHVVTLREVPNDAVIMVKDIH